MKHHTLAGAIGVVALVLSTAWTPLGRAHAITFTPPQGSGAPSQATGGASRGSLFTPNNRNRAPRQATGGASRGTLFQPNSRNRAPQQATGGASRGSLFQPGTRNRAPLRATGGASRNGFFQPNSRNRAPLRAAGGASRLGSYQLDPSIVASSGPAAMMALLPQSYYGTTLSERPTILVYLPASTAQEAVFSLKDEAGKSLYEMTMPISNEAGVRAITLPEMAPALEVGKNYQWFIALKVDGRLNPSTPYVDGWIQRIEPTAELAAALKQGDAFARAATLGRNGVWYDCVATLAALRAGQPNSDTFAKEWNELLSSVNLKEIGEAPILVSAN